MRKALFFLLAFCLLMGLHGKDAHADELLELSDQTAKIEILCDATYNEQGGPFSPREVVLYSLDDEVLSLLIVDGALLEPEAGWMGYTWEGDFSASSAGDYNLSVRGAQGSRLSATWRVSRQTYTHSAISALLDGCAVLGDGGDTPRYGDSLERLSIQPDPMGPACAVQWTQPGRTIDALSSGGVFTASVTVTLQDSNYQLDNGESTGTYSFSFPVEPRLLSQIEWPTLPVAQVTYGEPLPELPQANASGLPGARFRWQDAGPVTRDAGPAPQSFFMEITGIDPLYYALDGCDDSQEYLLAVAPAPLTLLGWGLPASHVYDGSALTPSPSLSQAVLRPGQDYSVTIRDAFGLESPLRDAGTYEIELMVYNGNYTFPGGTSLAIPFAIAPLEVAVQPEGDLWKWYGQADPPLRYGSTTRLSAAAQPPLFSGELERAPGEAPGSYALSVGSLHCESANYTLRFVEGTPFSIRAFDPPGVRARVSALPHADGSLGEPAAIEAPAGFEIATSGEVSGVSWASDLPLSGLGTHRVEYYLRSTSGNTLGAICGPYTLDVTLADPPEPEETPPLDSGGTPSSSPSPTPSPTPPSAPSATPSSPPPPLPTPSPSPSPTPTSLDEAQTQEQSPASDREPRSGVAGVWDEPPPRSPEAVSLLEWLLYGRSLADLPLAPAPPEGVYLPAITGWSWTHVLIPEERPEAPASPVQVLSLSPDGSQGLGLVGTWLYAFTQEDGRVSPAYRLDLSALLPGPEEAVYLVLPCDRGETLLVGLWLPAEGRLAEDLCRIWLPGGVAATLPGTSGASWFALSGDGAKVAWKHQDRLLRVRTGSAPQETTIAPDFTPAFGPENRLLTALDAEGLGLWWTSEELLLTGPLPAAFPGGQRGITLSRRSLDANNDLREEAIEETLWLDFAGNRLYFSPSGEPLPW